MSYVPLHLHSQYSLLDGLGTPAQIVARAKELGLPAVALTDHGVLYGAVEFYKAAKKAGIKPIIGCEVYIAPDGRFNKRTKEDAKNFHAIFLAKNEDGYRNLMQLSTLAHTEGYYYKPRIDYELMEKYHEGLIVLSGCINSEFAHAAIHQGIDAARAVALRYRDLFGAGNFYFELQYHPELSEQETVNTTAINLSKELGIPLVVTGDSHYIHPEQRDAHDVLLCVGTGSQIEDVGRMKFEGQFHLHTPEEVRAWFPDHPEAVENTKRIADACSLTIELGGHRIPKFQTPEGVPPHDHLRKICEQGIERFQDLAVSAEARTRLSYELDVIHRMGFDDYFLIVWDLVKFAKDQGIMVGPGRGSAAGSLVSYVLGITTIQPMQYGLIFERFLNPERVTMPDIDIDFPPEQRDRVLDYVREKYGKDNVAQLITFGTMKARAAIRDVGRVLGIPYGDVDRVAKLVPQKLGITLKEALDNDADFAAAYSSNPIHRRIVDLALQLEGVTRHASTHACAVVISEKPLVYYTPLQLASKNDTATVTQYHMKSIEDLGLLKMDFLGLSNLAIIERTIKIIKRTHELQIDMEKVPLNDKKTYELLSRGDTTGVFQLESSGMKHYLRDLKPTEIEDIIAMAALYRPGPMEFIPDYIAGKYGKKRIRYLHPILKPILEKTYGIAVYQEQVLEIAQAFAGFTLGEADVLRRAIGKKIRTELEAQRDKFIAGAVKNGIERDLAISVFKFIEPFADYGFNKSHAAGYAMIAFQTAYLKAHYPVEFMAALLSSEQGDSDRIAIEIEECRSMGINVLPPSINESLRHFTVADNGKDIRFGLSAIKNLGDGPALAIIAARKEGGAFTSIEDFASRVAVGFLNRKMLESLAKSGAFDDLAERNAILENSERILQFAKDRHSKAREGQMNLFALVTGSHEDRVQSLMLSECSPATKSQCLLWERELLGLYVTDHPLRAFRETLSARASEIRSISKADEGKKKSIGGIVQTVKRITTRNGESMLFAEMQDLSGSLECVVFPRVYQTSISMWRQDEVLLVEGTISFKEGRSDQVGSEPKLLVKSVQILTAPTTPSVSVEQNSGSRLIQNAAIAISLSAVTGDDTVKLLVPPGADDTMLKNLKEVLLAHRGPTPCVVVLTERDGRRKKVKLPFGITRSDSFDRSVSAVLSGISQNHAA